jgi:hypothetical protein
MINEFENIGKEAAFVQFKALSAICSQELRKARETSVRISGVRAET